MGITYEYTVPSMSHQSGMVEHKFVMLYNRVNAMLNGGKFCFLRNGLWAEAANTATILENNSLWRADERAHFDNFWEGSAKYSNFLTKI